MISCSLPAAQQISTDFCSVNNWNSGLFDQLFSIANRHSNNHHSPLCFSELHIFRCPIYIRKIMGHLSLCVALLSSVFIYVIRSERISSPRWWGVDWITCHYICVSVYMNLPDFKFIHHTFSWRLFLFLNLVINLLFNIPWY